MRSLPGMIAHAEPGPTAPLTDLPKWGTFGDLPENMPKMSLANMNGPMKVKLITSTMLRAITAPK